MKTRRKARGIGRIFQKVHDYRTLPSKLRGVRERCPPPNTVAANAELRKENRYDYEPDYLKVMQASLERYLKSKDNPKSIFLDKECLDSRKVLEGQKAAGGRKRKATNPIQTFDNRGGRRLLGKRPAWRRHPTSST